MNVQGLRYPQKSTSTSSEGQPQRNMGGSSESNDVYRRAVDENHVNATKITYVGDDTELCYVIVFQQALHSTYSSHHSP